MNGIEFVRFAGNGATTETSIGTDRFGTKRALVGVVIESSGTLEYARITSQDWGNRTVYVAPYADPTTAGGGGYWRPPVYPEIGPNSQIEGFVRQTGAPAAQAIVLMLMHADASGNYPAWVQGHLGELHSHFAEGTATNGNFPGRSAPTASQALLNQITGEMWLPLLGSAIGDSPGYVQFAHPRDDGYPPWIQTVAADQLGLDMFQAIPTTNPMIGPDTLSFLARDDSGSAVDMFLWLAQIGNGKAVKSTYAPPP